MQQGRKIVYYSVLVVVVLFFLAAGIDTMRQMHTTTQERTGFVMGTVMRQKLYGAAATDTELLEKQIQILDRELLSWRVQDSMVARLNENGEMALTEPFGSYIRDVLLLAEDSAGAFDPTLRPLIALWGIEGGNGEVPDTATLYACLQHIGYEKVAIRDDRIYLAEGMALDLGAVGKGIALDVARRYLVQQEVDGAVIAVGGSVLVYGQKPDGRFQIAIQDPDKEDGSAMGVLELSGTQCISTSGDYEKYFETDGKRYHHIFDRKTGYPADGELRSVTIVCDSGLASDGLSTACFVLDYEKSLPLLAKYEAEAVFVYADRRVIVTEGLRGCMTIKDSSYHMVEAGEEN